MRLNEFAIREGGAAGYEVMRVRDSKVVGSCTSFDAAKAAFRLLAGPVQPTCTCSTILPYDADYCPRHG